jgi:hypothetical protein
MKILLTILTLTTCVTVLATQSDTVYTPEKTYTCWECMMMVLGYVTNEVRSM